MVTVDRRMTPRFNLHTSLSFHRMEGLSDGEQRTKAINMSTGGIYFATTLAMRVGEAVEILLEMPRRVTGAKATVRRFTGRVSHIERNTLPHGLSGIGVQLLYYEHDSTRLGV